MSLICSWLLLAEKSSIVVI